MAKKKAGPVPLIEVPRRRQREAQAAARKRQAEGAPTKKQRKKHKKEGTTYEKPTKSADGSGAAWRRREFKDKGRNDFNKQRTARDAEAAQRRAHDVVIIPIFWRQRPGEEAAVVGEAERIKRLLSAAKLDIWVRTHKKSPGQKLAFWEEVGVTWRIEVGPDDVRSKKCVVSRAGEGRSSAEAALKIRDVSSVKRGDLLRALRDRLDCAKVPLLDVDGALDAEHSKEADAALRKWREAAGALPAPLDAAQTTKARSLIERP